MVSGDHEEIALPHSGDEVGHELVKLGGSGGIACYIAALAVEHIEVHQIHKGKALKVAGDVYKRQAVTRIRNLQKFIWQTDLSFR